MPECCGPESDSPESFSTRRWETGAPLPVFPLESRSTITFVFAILADLKSATGILADKLRGGNRLAKLNERSGQKKSAAKAGGFFTMARRALCRRHRGCFRFIRRPGGRPRSIHFAHFKSGKAADSDVLAKFRDGLIHQLLYRHALVFNEMLLVETILFIKLFHLSVHDFLDYVFRLARCFCLFLVNVAFAIEGFLRHFLAAQKSRIEGGNVHRYIVAQTLKISGTSYEIALTIHFHQHADFPTGMDVVTHQSLGGRPLRFLCRGSLTLFPQNIDGLLDVALGFEHRSSTSRETCTGAIAQFLYKLSRYVGIARCSHRFTRFLMDKFGLCGLWFGVSSATLQAAFDRRAESTPFAAFQLQLQNLLLRLPLHSLLEQAPSTFQHRPRRNHLPVFRKPRKRSCRRNRRLLRRRLQRISGQRSAFVQTTGGPREPRRKSWK